jgi:hypothetical protein
MGRQAVACKSLLPLERCVTPDLLISTQTQSLHYVWRCLVRPPQYLPAYYAKIPSGSHFHEPCIMSSSVKRSCSIILKLEQVLSHDAKLGKHSMCNGLIIAAGHATKTAPDRRSDRILRNIQWAKMCTIHTHCILSILSHAKSALSGRRLLDFAFVPLSIRYWLHSGTGVTPRASSLQRAKHVVKCLS